MDPMRWRDAQQRLLGGHRARLQLHDGRAGGLHRRAVLRAAIAARRRGHALLLAGHPDAQRRRELHAGGGPRWAASSSSPNFQHASVPPTPIAARRRRRRLRHRRVPVDPGAGAGQELHDRDRGRTPRSARSSSRPRPTPRRTPRTTIYPVGTTLYWRVRANNDDSKGLAWSGTSTLRADAARAHDHDGRAVPRAPRSRRSRGRRSTAPPATRCRTCGPTASAHVTTTVPSAAVSYTKMTGTGHGTRAGARALRTAPRAPTRRRATSSTRSPSRAAPRRS